MMRSSLGWIVLCVLYLGCPCFSQQITIRVIDAGKGQPLGKQQVSIQFLYGEREKPPENYKSPLQLETDASGQVEFRLPEPAPAHLEARARLTPERWRCGCVALLATRELIQNGFAGPDPVRGPTLPAGPVKANPGEIVFVARPLTFWGRLLYPFVKG
jgi:hypothetical protein